MQEEKQRQKLAKDLSTMDKQLEEHLLRWPTLYGNGEPFEYEGKDYLQFMREKKLDEELKAREEKERQKRERSERRGITPSKTPATISVSSSAIAPRTPMRAAAALPQQTPSRIAHTFEHSMDPITPVKTPGHPAIGAAKTPKRRRSQTLPTDATPLKTPQGPRPTPSVAKVPITKAGATPLRPTSQNTAVGPLGARLQQARPKSSTIPARPTADAAPVESEQRH